jgi:hypothetical protein
MRSIHTGPLQTQLPSNSGLENSFWAMMPDTEQATQLLAKSKEIISELKALYNAADFHPQPCEVCSC